MQIITGKPLKPVWLKAAVVGSIWASVEIILGSFLHNLKIPVTGLIMSFVSVWILISFVQVWKEKGLVWRAGLICALMKSISPSAIILGPMIGIMTEALLIEFFIFSFGRNLFAYIIGGAFAVLSTIIQKIISLLITYGLDLVRIAEDLYRFVVRQIKLENVSPGYLILIIALIYVATGATAAVAGYISGRRQSKNEPYGKEYEEIRLQPGNELLNNPAEHDYSLVLLFVNLSSIIAVLVLLNFGLQVPAFIVSALYLLFCITRYRRSLYGLKRVSFWIAFLVITFTAAFLWDRVSSGVFFSIDGFLTGLKMNARAVVMVVGFASISIELKNPVIKSVLYNKGFTNLYQSLNLSFSALPYFISNISEKGNDKIINSIRKSKGFFRHAEILYNIFDRELKHRPDVVIITGELHSGKTSFAEKIINSLLDKGIRIGGFLSIGINKEQRRTGFILQEISTPFNIELCSDIKDENRLNYGHFYFNMDALAAGEKILSTENLSDKQLIVIDEIGPLELKNLGWSRAIDNICRTVILPQLWVVRKSIVSVVLKKWNVGKAFIYDIETDNEPDVLRKLNELIIKGTY